MKRFHPEDGRYKCPDCESSNTVFIGAVKGIVVMECQSCGRRFKTEQKPMPPVDTVSVVRCGECKHMMPDGRCSEFADLYVRPSVSDFCSYGERREETANV